MTAGGMREHPKTPDGRYLVVRGFFPVADVEMIKRDVAYAIGGGACNNVGTPPHRQGRRPRKTGLRLPVSQRGAATARGDWKMLLGFAPYALGAVPEP